MNEVAWVVLGILLACCIPASAVGPSIAEMSLARAWVRSSFGPGQHRLPFSFRIGEQSSQAYLRGCQESRTVEKLDGHRTRTTIVWTREGSGLEVRCVVITYADFPVAEWTLWFRNNGPQDTLVLADILAADLNVPVAGQNAVLHHNVGSPANRSDYGPLTTHLPVGAVKRITAAGGRPTNTDLCYFNLEVDSGGLITAVGWPGQWAAEYHRDRADSVDLRVGQERTSFLLHPGEEVRSPLIVLLWWKRGRGDDWIRGQNLWRRWMMAHSMPRPGGKLPPPQFVASSSRAYEEMIGANEANQIMHIDRYLALGLKLDYWWMDAGWYIQEHGWPQVGTWEPDPRRFPRGFKPISDHAHARGVKILVWFEPERVAPGTWLAENHPEWLLSADPAREKSLAALRVWHSPAAGTDPCVVRNTSAEVLTIAGIRWEPGQLSFHPGPNGEYAVVRWTAPSAGAYNVSVTFRAIDQQTTTDVHIFHGVRRLLDGALRLGNAGPVASFEDAITAIAGETLDFVVGWGNGSHICDSTGLEVKIAAPDGTVYDAAREFSPDQNPAGVWSYGYVSAGSDPDPASFRLFEKAARGSDNSHRLFNLGNPEAWRWLVEHIDRLITENGIDLYRQDFNIDPIGFWRANDAEDRQGITEIKHVMGYLAFWDELRRRHPNMLIDSCASGGRRNDLETMRRAVPLWRSDYAFEAIGHQCMTYGISLWLPYHGTATVACDNAPYYGGGKTPVQPYAFWSNTAPSLGSGIDVREELDFDTLRRLIAAWRELSPNYYGDFYPLTPYTLDATAWIAWQFDRPEVGEGAVQAFRRNECPETSLTVRLRGVDRKATYTLKDLDTGTETVVSGRRLAERGLAITMSLRPGAVNILYRKVRAR